MHDCRINNYHGLCSTEASMFTIDIAVRDDDDVREEQAGFRLGRGCIDHIFTLRQILEQRHAYRWPTILVFLDFKGAFDSVDRIALLNVLGQQGIPLKFVKIIRSLYSQTQGRVRAYGELSNYKRCSSRLPFVSVSLQLCHRRNNEADARWFSKPGRSHHDWRESS